jgi:hypothetical protein
MLSIDPDEKLLDRLWANVASNIETRCLEWFGHKKAGGYGHVHINHKTLLAHRVFWAIQKGHIPDGICVLHKCNNPSCCNVDHLYLGTKKRQR